jgi:hypothetical protein
MNESYFEVVVEGSFNLMKGFVVGFLEGRGVAGDVFFGKDYHIEKESPVGLLMRLTGTHDKTCTVIVGAGLHGLLAAALEKRRHVIPLRMVQVRQVSSAAFDVMFRTYSKEVGTEINDLLNQLPEGVIRESDFEMHEMLTPEGKGIDAYAPLHEYKLDGKGRISGSVKGVFDLYFRLGRYEVVDLGDMELTYGEDL